MVSTQDLAAGMQSGAVKSNKELENALSKYLSRVNGAYHRADHDPDVFRLPFAGLEPGATATVDVCYFQELKYDEGE